MIVSARALRMLNLILSQKYFPGKWRIEKFIISIVKVRTGHYFHPRGFWWSIENDATKKTFLVDCENTTSELISKLLKNERVVFVDIGANLGWYSLLVKSLNPSSIVYAFEPMAWVREKLHQNLQRNGFSDVKIESCALGASSATRRIYSYLGNDGMHTLWPVKEWGAEPGQEVKIEVLDSYTEQLNEKNLPILLKLDVEGSELNVLQGCNNLLSGGNVQMIIEINETMLSAAGNSVEELFEFLRSFGFSGYWISPDMTLVASSFENSLPHRGKLPEFEGTNYFFTKNKMEFPHKT